MNYLISWFKIVFSGENFGFIIFIIMNILPICLCYTYYSPLAALFMTPVVFAVYLLFNAFVGESIARIMLKAFTRVKLEERTVLNAAFSNAYVAARSKQPLISQNIRLYIFESTQIDGFAFGRRTLCISSRALELPERELTVLFMSKFAQFAHHDSEILAILTAGNLWYILYALIVKLTIYLFGFTVLIIASFFVSIFKGFGALFFGRALHGIADFSEKAVMLLLRGILMIGVKSYKNNVFINDRFVCDCGMQKDLIRYIRDFEPEQFGSDNLFAAINSMKPNKHTRINRLNNYTPTTVGGSHFKIIRS